MTPFQELLLRSTIPLRMLDDFNRPKLGYACGVMVSYREKRFFLTVQHSVGHTGDWAIEIEYDQELGEQKMYRLGSSLWFLKKPVLGGMEIIDFAFCLLPETVVSYYQEFTQEDVIKGSQRRFTFCIDSNTEFTASQEYGFAGFVLPSLEYGKLRATPEIITGMRYLRMEDDLAAFSFNNAYGRNNEYFEGASGAPIIDLNGDVVALLEGGDTEKQEIYGVPLINYKGALLGAALSE